MKFDPNAPGPNPADDPDMLASVVPGYWFDCHTIQDVDAHICRQLHDFINTTSNVTDRRRQQAREDVDNLLSRRSYLETVAPAA